MSVAFCLTYIKLWLWWSGRFQKAVMDRVNGSPPDFHDNNLLVKFQFWKIFLPFVMIRSLRINGILQIKNWSDFKTSNWFSPNSSGSDLLRLSHSQLSWDDPILLESWHTFSYILTCYFFSNCVFRCLFPTEDGRPL